MINKGEIALAIIGLYPVINRDIPRWTLERQKELDDFEDEISGLADKCIKGQLPLGDLKVYGQYESLLERIKKPLSPEDIRAIQYKFPSQMDETASEFIVFIQNIWAHLAEIFPVSEYLTFLGPINLTPTGEKTWQFFLKLLVLNDPRSVYKLISSGAMLKSWARVVKEFYPTLSEAITKSLYAAVAKTKAENEKFLMNAQTSFGLANWLERRSVDYDPNPAAPVKPANSLGKSSAAPQAGVSLSPSEQITQAGQAK